MQRTQVQNSSILQPLCTIKELSEELCTVSCISSKIISSISIPVRYFGTRGKQLVAFHDPECGYDTVPLGWKVLLEAAACPWNKSCQREAKAAASHCYGTFALKHVKCFSDPCWNRNTNCSGEPFVIVEHYSISLCLIIILILDMFVKC